VGDSRSVRASDISDAQGPIIVRSMRSKGLSVLVSVLLLGGCTTPHPPHPPPTFGMRTRTYHDPAGWSIEVPVSWSVLPFETTKGDASSVGTQISNMPLSSPTIEPGAPIQTIVLPRQGVSMIVATDDDPSDVQKPPGSLPSPPLSFTDSGFVDGSCIARETACLSFLWFTVAGETLLISIKTGPFAPKADRAILAPLVGSIRAGD